MFDLIARRPFDNLGRNRYGYRFYLAGGIGGVLVGVDHLNTIIVYFAWQQFCCIKRQFFRRVIDRYAAHMTIGITESRLTGHRFAEHHPQTGTRRLCIVLPRRFFKNWRRQVRTGQCGKVKFGLMHQPRPIPHRHPNDVGLSR